MTPVKKAAAATTTAPAAPPATPQVAITADSLTLDLVREWCSANRMHLVSYSPPVREAPQPVMVGEWQIGPEERLAFGSDMLNEPEKPTHIVAEMIERIEALRAIGKTVTVRVNRDRSYGETKCRLTLETTK